MSWLNGTYYHLGESTPTSCPLTATYILGSNMSTLTLRHKHHAHTLNKYNINNNNSITITLKALSKMSFWIAYTEKRKGAFPETILQNITH